MGVDQWQNGYPDDQAIIQDIKNQCAYTVLYEQKIIGYFALIGGIENNYLNITGNWQSDRPYLTIHRNMLKAGLRGKGYGEEMFLLIEKIAREMNYDYIRVDTHADNRIMNHLLGKLDYRYAGIIYLADGAKRLAYDKILI